MRGLEFWGFFSLLYFGAEVRELGPTSRDVYPRLETSEGHLLSYIPLTYNDKVSALCSDSARKESC